MLIHDANSDWLSIHSDYDPNIKSVGLHRSYSSTIGVYAGLTAVIHLPCALGGAMVLALMSGASAFTAYCASYAAVGAVALGSIATIKYARQSSTKYGAMISLAFSSVIGIEATNTINNPDQLRMVEAVANTGYGHFQYLHKTLTNICS